MRKQVLEDVDKYGLKQGELQLASYAAEMLSAETGRTHVFGARVNGDKMTVAMYSNEGIIEAEPFSMLTDQEYLGMFLLMFQRDPSTYGFNKTTGYCDPFDLSNVETRKMDLSVLTKVEDTGDEFDLESARQDQVGRVRRYQDR